MRYILICTITLFAIACSSNKVATSDQLQNKTTATNTLENLDVALDLSDHLRKVPGVRIKGRGPSAEVKIRSNASFALSEEPLYVLDGKQLNNYSQLYSAVIVADIENIEVLKNASETGFYGARGSNGVIVITTKKY